MTELLKERNHDTSLRKNVMFSLWTRPIIPFKLECEHLNAKENIVSEIQDTVLYLNGDSSITLTSYGYAFQALLSLFAA